MSFRELTMSSDDFDDEGRPTKYEVLYPEPKGRQAAFPAWQLPYGVGKLYAETLTAFNHKAMILAAAGLPTRTHRVGEDDPCQSGCP
jgi:hypothetical protein